MCRLFALNAGLEPVRATFWLLEAEDSLARQSRANPDGYGIATFEPDGTPDVEKRAAAAYEDECFAREAREERSPTFLAHVRYASAGPVVLRNTHPFEQRGRVFALNVLLAVDGEVWALRYPDAHTLLVLERHAGGPSGERSLDAASPAGTVRMRSGDLSTRPSVVFASVRMDEDPGWRPLGSGELVHVDAGLRVTSSLAVDHAPMHQLTLADLDPRAAAAQRGR